MPISSSAIGKDCLWSLAINVLVKFTAAFIWACLKSVFINIVSVLLRYKSRKLVVAPVFVF